MINWEYKYLIVTNFWWQSQFTKNCRNFPSNSQNLSRTQKSKIEQISSNSPPNRVVLLAASSNHLLLLLFWQGNIKILKIRDCWQSVHQWHLEISSTRSEFEPSYELQSTHLSSFFICFEKPRANTTGISTAISRYFKIESHELMNCYMLFEECSM